MKKYILAIIVLASCFACQPTEDEKAAPLMKKIETLYHDDHPAACPASTGHQEPSARIGHLAGRKSEDDAAGHRTYRFCSASYYTADDQRAQPASPQPAACQARFPASTLRRTLWYGQNHSCTTETKQAIVDGPTLQSDRGWRVKPFLCSSYQLYSCYSQGQRGLFIEEKLLM